MVETILTTLGEILSHVADLCEVIVVALAIYDRIREIKNDRQDSANTGGQKDRK